MEPNHLSGREVNAFALLKPEPTDDIGKIKKACAARLKDCDPETDPDGWMSLYDAYTAALRAAQGEREPYHGVPVHIYPGTDTELREPGYEELFRDLDALADAADAAEAEEIR